MFGDMWESAWIDRVLELSWDRAVRVLTIDETLELFRTRNLLDAETDGSRNGPPLCEHAVDGVLHREVRRA